MLLQALTLSPLHPAVGAAGARSSTARNLLAPNSTAAANGTYDSPMDLINTRPDMSGYKRLLQLLPAMRKYLYDDNLTATLFVPNDDVSMQTTQ